MSYDNFDPTLEKSNSEIAKKVKAVAADAAHDTERMPSAVVVKQICTVCGTVFEKTHHTQKKCPECRAGIKKTPQVVATSVEEDVQVALPDASTLFDYQGVRVAYDVEIENFEKVHEKTARFDPYMNLFMASDYKNVCFDMGDVDQARKLGRYLRSFIKRRGFAVQAAVRGAAVYLIKKDA